MPKRCTLKSVNPMTGAAVITIPIMALPKALRGIKRSKKVPTCPYLDAPVRRLCGPDAPAMGFAPTLERAFVPDVAHVRRAIAELVAY